MYKKLQLCGILLFALTLTACPSENNDNREGNDRESTTNNTTTTETTDTNTQSQDGKARTDNTVSGANGKLPAESASFLAKAMQGGLAEVQLGQRGAEKATHADVKAFANHLVNDHGKANKEITTLASSKDATLPGQPNEQQVTEMQKLDSLSGAAFDKEFVNINIKMHEQTISEFQKQSATDPDPEVKALAAKTLPTLQQHLQMAKDLQAKLK